MPEDTSKMSDVEFDILKYTFYNTLEDYIEVVNSGADIPNNMARFLIHIQSDYEHECEVRGQ